MNPSNGLRTHYRQWRQGLLTCLPASLRRLADPRTTPWVLEVADPRQIRVVQEFDDEKTTHGTLILDEGKLKGSANLKAGQAFFLDSTLGLTEGTKKGVGVALETLHKDVKAGDTLLLNDGLISLQVDSVEGTRIHTTVVDGGILSDHKGINLKGGGLSAAALTDVDR